ncbi:MAG: zinc-ribbon domain-containing protein [Desulfotomaculaceae bacterium]|nr:zinc-ribbon domain-containing protein [Desulfotomaculaceae bacterium]
MFCPACGKENPNDAKFCRKCGKPIISSIATKPSSSSPEPMTVQPKLKDTLTSQTSSAGAIPVNQQLSSREFEAVEPKGKKAHGIFAAVAVVSVILILAALGYFAYDKLIIQKRFMGKIDKALAENKFFSPAGDNVVDIFKTKKAESPQSDDLKEAAAKIRMEFGQVGDAAFQRFYSESDDNDWENVINIYTFLYDLDPSSQEMQARMEFAIAHGLIKKGRRENFIDALSKYQKALQLKPHWVLAINGIAKVYVRKNSPYYNKIEALNWYHRASEVDPNFPWAYTNIAAIYAEDRQWNMAEQALVKALNLKQDRPSILVELGALCEKQEKKLDAKNYYQEALKFEKNPEKINWLQNKISSIQ